VYILKDSTARQAGKNYLSVALSRDVVVRALKVAIIVGTILTFINHGEKILSVALSGQDWFKVILTYWVPYCVSTWSAVAAIKANTSNDE
jgi:hypothetical protein